MEKYTKESLAKMMPEELENVVLELQEKVETTQKDVDMYKGFWNSERVQREKEEKKIKAMSMLLQSWE